MPPTPAPMPGPIDKSALRRRLLALRRALPDREALEARLAAVLGTWLAAREERAIGAYWPIRGEFDPLPVLGAWRDAGEGRRTGLPVIEPDDTLAFREWWPGCAMEPGAYGIPVPAGTPPLVPDLLLVPCVGFGPGGIRLGYGGGFYDRTLAVRRPRPATVGIAFAAAYVAGLVAAAHDIPLDAVLTEDGPAHPPR